MKDIRQIRDIVRLLNDEFEPKDIVNEIWSYGKLHKTTVVKRKPHFTAFFEKHWKIYCDNMDVWSSECFILYKKEVVKMLAKQGTRVKFEYIHPVTVEIKLSNQMLVIAPARLTSKVTF